MGIRQAAGNAWRGQVMAVALWRRALTDTEVAAAGKQLLGTDVAELGPFRRQLRPEVNERRNNGLIR